ncbi:MULTISPECIES: NADPH dehydrogenase NamA [unclassified Sedimentibacter]|uniref:NADPH dehydrogenase NamA n=1 Tax=unclassified Sedimentibacter TaxID=2649220 RepID=UPI0027E13A08|nr:NADPH dehydrogenase NamA [Sedimentibacter sp. MB35-C1]WMJ77646.1 NADPH dehydrogenase NamA [Sedimentibacter sp. MB35-C1]
MSRLFSNYIIKNLELKNRIVMAPMCMYSSENDGKVTEWHVLHYATRAVGGAGLIIQEATAVEPEGRISSSDLGIWEDSQVEGLKKIVDACKKYGAKIGIQLNHAGRKCEAENERIIAPSSIAYSDRYRIPAEMTTEEIHEVIKSFGYAAERCVRAGYDVIEIHGAHGYLINQFLSPLTNKRTDEYGGSKERRARFLKEVIREVRKVWTEEKALLLRVSAEEYDEEGNRPEDLAEMINMVKDEGINLIDVSSGGVVNIVPERFQGYQIRLAEKIKEKTELPVITGGLIIEPQMAEEILRNRRADLVFIGRAFLKNPYWPLYADEKLSNIATWPKQYEAARTGKI